MRVYSPKAARSTRNRAAMSAAPDTHGAHRSLTTAHDDITPVQQVIFREPGVRIGDALVVDVRSTLGDRPPGGRLAGTTPPAASTSTTVGRSPLASSWAAPISAATSSSMDSGSSRRSERPKTASAAWMAASRSAGPWTNAVTSSASTRCAARCSGCSDVRRARFTISSRSRSENTFRYSMTLASSVLRKYWWNA